MAAVERGFHVELFEQANSLGGRAGSLVDSETGDRIDYCQHVAMGCCTRFLDFCRRTGIDDCFDRTAELHFIAPDGQQYDFAPSRWLPPPLHLLPGLMRLKYLSLGERWGIIRTLRRLVRRTAQPEMETIGHWLRRQGQSERVVNHFWSVVLVSALGETVDHASLAAARKVFIDGFFASRGASDLVLPRMPLGAIFHDRMSRWLAVRGVVVHLGTPVRHIVGDRQHVNGVILADGTRREFDSVVAAVPWHSVKTLFNEDLLSAMPELADVERIEPGAITAVHLWFDRPITPLPHAVLIDRLSQWMFAEANRYQVVISASHRLPERKHDVLVAEVRRELEEVWKASVGAAVELLAQRLTPRLLHSRVITQRSAVFSVQPGVDRFRPGQQTPIGNLALAGDWTATDWTATMEGAVRSGYQAVEVLWNQRIES